MQTIRWQAPLVGRQRELSRLIAGLDAARTGSGSIALVAGEPGIGKTRLVAELARHARTVEALVLLGHAYDGDGLPPYFPFVEALRSYLRERVSAPPATPLPTDGLAQLSLLLPELRDRFPDLPAGRVDSPELEHYRLYEAVTDLIESAARDAGGALFLLEDLHWADAASLALLRHVARRLPGLPLMLVATCRTVAPRPGHPLEATLAELVGAAQLERVQLRPLPAESVSELIAAVSGAPPASTVAGRVYTETDGNPFFVTELVRHLQENGIDLTDPHAGGGRWTLPEGVRQVIHSRLVRLGADGTAMLGDAAILGDRFAFDLLAGMSELSAGQLTAALDAALAASLLREVDDGYAFMHALVRQAVLSGLSLPRRQQLHLRAAQAIERRRPRLVEREVADLARHLRLAGSSADPEKTAAYLRRAAEAAERTFAWAAAAEQWQALLKLLPPEDPEQRTRVLLALAEAQARAGALQAGWATFSQAGELALANGLAAPLAEAALGRARYPGTGMVGPDLLEAALRLLPAEDSSLRVRVLSRIAQSMPTTIARQERRKALLDEAMAMARRLGDPATLLMASLAWLVSEPSSPAWRDAVMELLQLTNAAGDRQWTHLGFLWRQQLLVRLGDRAEALASLAIDQALAEKLREPVYLYNLALATAMWAMLEGRFADAERQIAGAFALGERAQQPLASFWQRLQGAELLRCQGRYGKLLVDLGDELRRSVRQEPTESHWRAQLAHLYAKTGHLRDARRELDVLAVNDFGDLRGPTGWNWLICLGLLPEVCVALGDTQRAAPLYDYLGTYRGHCIVIGPHTSICFGAADRYRGMLAALLGRHEDARAHYAAAVDLNRRIGARPQLAHSLREYATEVCSAGADTVLAQPLLEEALLLYDELGLTGLAAVSRELLDRVAGRSRNGATRPDHLSAREVEVLRQIAAGKTNRELAAALVISEGTVERHISNLYGKIGARNRAEATNYARDHDLSGP
ncbi:MAG TPA: AAA family ATPase [Dehalococcoidia bacterium]|nr:AAA family ATPase [Dehalococcoidia bacterium]